MNTFKSFILVGIICLLVSMFFILSCIFIQFHISWGAAAVLTGSVGLSFIFAAFADGEEDL